MANLASQKTLATLAQAMISSKILYGIQAWSGTSIENRNKIQKIINQSARIALGPKSSRMSIYKMMSQLGWMGLDQMSDQHTLMLAINTANTGYPKSLNNKLSQFKTRTTRNSCEITRIPPSWKHEKSRWSYTNRAVHLLNNSPVHLQELRDKPAKKKAIKEHVKQTTSYYLTPIGSTRQHRLPG